MEASGTASASHFRWIATPANRAAARTGEKSEPGGASRMTTHNTTRNSASSASVRSGAAELGLVVMVRVPSRSSRLTQEALSRDLRGPQQCPFRDNPLQRIESVG